MAATQTVAQPFHLRKSTHDSSELKPRCGVVTLSGYGISVRVDRGHLLLEDGFGEKRRRSRISRVDRGLRHLVVIGADGMVSLSALRWLADRDASFAMLDRDGSVLVATGPVHSSDVRLRRAQALALQNGTALTISRELIDRKLAAQERVVKDGFRSESAALAIRQWRSELAEASSIEAVRSVEAQGAKIYWATWRGSLLVAHRSEIPKISAIVNYGVPFNGSTFARLATLLSPDATLRAMTNNEEIEALRSDWLSIGRDIKMYCAYETMPVKGITVVGQSSATAMCNQSPIAIPANQIDLVKPCDRNDVAYQYLKLAIQESTRTTSKQAN